MDTLGLLTLTAGSLFRKVGTLEKAVVVLKMRETWSYSAATSKEFQKRGQRPAVSE